MSVGHTARLQLLPYVSIVYAVRQHVSGIQDEHSLDRLATSTLESEERAVAAADEPKHVEHDLTSGLADLSAARHFTVTSAGAGATGAGEDSRCAWPGA